MESGKKMEFLAEVSNVSRGGMLLMTYQQKIYPETRVTIDFKVPPKTEAFCVHGTVVRSYRLGDQIWHYMAVQLEDRHTAAIELLLETCK